MKKTFSILILVAATLIYSCGNNSANKTAEQIQSAVKENTPGSIPTSAAGYSMKAKINGKEWVADDMMPPEATGRILGTSNKESISLPYYDRRDMVMGEKTNFERSAVDLFLNDEIGIWGGHKGQMEITKVDEHSAEGKFYFTATSFQTTKSFEVTDGFFRILFSEK